MHASQQQERGRARTHDPDEAHVPEHVRRASQRAVHGADQRCREVRGRILEKFPLHHDIDKYIREWARAEDGKGHDAADRREHLRAWDATIEDNRLRAQKSQEAKDEKALKISKISLLNIHSTTYEDLNKLLGPALDKQIDKIRAVGTEYIAAKTSFEGATDGEKPRERKIDAIVSAFKLPKKLPELHEGKLAEDEPLKPHEEDAEPDDIEMVYPDKIQSFCA
jgi:hypothetical protein